MKWDAKESDIQKFRNYIDYVVRRKCEAGALQGRREAIEWLDEIMKLHSGEQLSYVEKVRERLFIEYQVRRYEDATDRVLRDADLDALETDEVDGMLMRMQNRIDRMRRGY